MYSHITYATVQECGSRQYLELKPSSQINFIQGRDSEGFLLALAGLFGGLPEACFRSMEEYKVKAHVVWTDNLTCELGAGFSKEEKRIWVHSVENSKSGLSAHSPEKVKAIHKRRFRNGTNTAHIFDNCAQSISCERLGESDEALRRFTSFLEETHLRSTLGDTRPIFLYNFLERLDEGVDIGEILKALATTGRQVFIAVPHSYQIKTLEEIPYDAAIHTL